jgi:hypothetical protein
VLNDTSEDIFREKVKANPDYLEICEKIFKKTEYLVYTKEETEKARLKEKHITKSN